MALTLSRTVQGLKFYDDFERSTVGTDYIDGGAELSIVGGKLRILGTGAGHIQRTNNAAVLSLSETFMQATYTPSSGGAEIGCAVQNGSSFNGYFAQLYGGNARLHRTNGFVVLSSTAFAVVAGVDYKIQLYGKYGEQKLWINGALITQAADTTDVSAAGNQFFRCTIAGTVDVDKLAIAAKRTLLVSSLPAGYKAQVKSAAGAVVLGPTVASSGSVTFDFGGISFPAGSVEVLDAADALVASFAAADVSPGDVYALTGHVDPNAPAPVVVSAISQTGATIAAGAFSSADGAATHTARRVRVRRTSDSAVVYGPVVVSTGTLTAPHVVTGLSVGAAGLVGEVSDVDQFGGTSAWATSAPFATHGPGPAKPTVVATPSPTTVVLAGSSFSDTDLGDTHAATRWQVTLNDDASFSAAVYDSGPAGEGAPNLASITIEDLEPGVAYRGRCQYRDSEGEWSPWSDVVTWTQAPPPDGPLSPGHVGNMTGPQFARVTSQRYPIRARVLLENGAGVMVNYGDFSDLGGVCWFVSARWSLDVDKPVSDGTLSLARSVGDLSLAPLIVASGLNRDAGDEYSPAIWAGRGVEVWTTHDEAGDPATWLWSLDFVGKTDNVLWPEETVDVNFRDLGAWLVDTQIRDEITYEPLPGEEETGMPVTGLIQRIINDWPHKPGVEVTLVVRDEPNWFILKHTQKKETSVFEAIRLIASQCGGDVRYDLGELVFWMPRRDEDTPDITLGPTQYVKVTQIKGDDAGIRNHLRLDTYYNDAGEAQPPIEVVDPISIDEYGDRYMRLSEAATTLIRTSEVASRYLSAIAADVGEPELSHGIQLRYFKYARLGDIYGYLPNLDHYDQTQVAANQAIAHELTGGGGWTTIDGAPRARGAYALWLRKGGRPGVPDTPGFTPQVSARVLASSTTSVTYRVSAWTTSGEAVTLYVAEGDALFGAAGPNPVDVTLTRGGVDVNQRTAHLLARSASGGETIKELTADFDFDPGLSNIERLEPLFSASEQMGWRQGVAIDDDARGLLVVLSGEVSFLNATPATAVPGVVAGQWWVDTDEEKLVVLSFGQGPGQTGDVTYVPYELFATTVGAAGSAGKPYTQHMARSPITEAQPRDVNSHIREITLTPNPPNSTVKYRLGSGSWQTVLNAISVVVQGVDVAAGDVTLEFYSVSSSGVAENIRRLVLTASPAPVISATFLEDPAGTVRATLVVNQNVLSWDLWARRLVSPLDRAGAPIQRYHIDGGSRQQLEVAFAGQPGLWVIAIRGRDKNGAYDQHEYEFTITGSASTSGYLFNVQAALHEEPAASGVWYNDVVWDLSSAIIASPEDYEVSVNENGVELVAGRDPTIDHDSTAGEESQGGYHVRKMRTVASDPFANYLVFVYAVTLLYLGEEPGITYNAEVAGYYVGDGAYEEEPTGAPNALALFYEFDTIYASGVWILRATWALQPEFDDAKVDIRWRSAETVPDLALVPDEDISFEELPRGTEQYVLVNPWGDSGGLYYQFSVRERNNGGVGEWSAWSVARRVAGTGSGGGGLEP